MAANPSSIMLATALMAVGLYFLLTTSTPKPSQLHISRILKPAKANTMTTPHFGIAKHQGMHHSSASLISSSASVIQDFSPSMPFSVSAAVMASSILLVFATVFLAAFKLLRPHQRTVPIFVRHHHHALDPLEGIKSPGSQYYSATKVSCMTSQWDPLGILHGAEQSGSKLPDGVALHKDPVAMFATSGLFESGADLVLNGFATTDAISHVTVLAFCPVCAMEALTAGFWLLIIPVTFVFNWIRDLTLKLLRGSEASSSMALLLEEPITDGHDKSAEESAELQNVEPSSQGCSKCQQTPSA